MPPSEHVLIDKLSYRGARVVSSWWLGGDAQMWIVMEGGRPLTRKQRKFMREMFALMMDDDDEAPARSPEAAASQNEDHEPREVLGSPPAEVGTDGDCSQPKTETV